MTARQLFVVLVRVWGICVFVIALILVATTLGGLSELDIQGRDLPLLFFPLLPLVLAVFLLRQADWIADRFRWPADTAAETGTPQSAEARPGEWTRLAATGGGLIALVYAMEPLATVISRLLLGGGRPPLARLLWSHQAAGLQTILLLALATTCLVLGTRGGSPPDRREPPEPTTRNVS